MAYHGVGLFDMNAFNGVNSRRRNPKKKARLPYHAKQFLNPPIISVGQPKCHHALGRFETVTNQNGKQITMSYALPCVVGHKSTTQNPTHKDNLKGVWK
jgi:hypothetical protein